MHAIDNKLKEKEKYEMLMLPHTALTESKEVSADTENLIIIIILKTHLLEIQSECLGCLGCTPFYDISIGSPRPEVVRALLISERLRNVAAPSPVFLNSSLNILNSFSLS